MIYSESDIPVYTSIYIVYAMFKFDTTLQVHWELRSISLASSTGLSTTLVAFNHSCMPPFFSCLN